MPRTNLTPQEPTRLVPLQSITSATPDVANGNSFPNSGRNVIMIVSNESGGSVTCTVDVPGTFEGVAHADKVYTIPDTETWVIGPFSSVYNQTDNGGADRVLFNFNISTDVTVQLIKVTTAI